MPQMNRKLVVGKALSVDESKFTLTAVISTGAKDRDGDIVEPRGVILDAYNQNPVVLWAHDKKMPPPAKSLEVLVSENTVLSHVLFDKDDGFARMIFMKYARGFLNAWSIGFGAEENAVDPLTDEDGMITGFHFKEWELREFSAVPVPANAQALTREIAEMESKHVMVFCKGYDAVPKTHQDESLLELYKGIIDEKAFTARNHNNKTAESEPAWGRVNKTKLPRVAFAWQAPGTNNQEKSTWKFPHHWVEDGGDEDAAGVFTTGKMYLHRGGLNAAWAAAMGARSGQRAAQAVINHLQAHRKALGIEDSQRIHTVRWSKDGMAMQVEKDFEELGDDESPFEDVTKALGQGAFKKSIEERGDSIPVTMHVGDETAIEVDFLVVKETDGTVTEARVLQARATVPILRDPDALTPEESSRNGKSDGEGEDGGTSSEAAINPIEELEVGILDLRARIAEL